MAIGYDWALFKFILLHSSAFMANILNQQQDAKNQVKVSVGLLTFYTLMMWAFEVSLDTPGAALNFRRHHFGTLPQSATKLVRQQKSDCGEIEHWRATLRARRIWHTVSTDT